MKTFFLNNTREYEVGIKSKCIIKDQGKILFLKQKPHTSPYNPKGYWYIDDDNKILVATRQVKSGTKADEGGKPTISPPWTKPEWGTIELIIDRGQLLRTDKGVRWKMQKEK